MWQVVANFWVLGFFVLAAVHIGLVTVFLSIRHCYFLFCNFWSLYEWEGVLPLKVKPGSQSLEMGYHVYFRLQAGFFYRGAEPA